MITMVQASSTVGKSWVRIGLFQEQGMMELTINGQTITPTFGPTDWPDTIAALKEVVAKL